MIRFVSWRCLFWLLLGASFATAHAAAPGAPDAAAVAVASFPPSLESYADAHLTGSGLGAVLRHRVSLEPFNLVASLLFGLAILHTFVAVKFKHLAESVHEKHRAQWWALAAAAEEAGRPAPRETSSVLAGLLHFLGEVEAVFGLWVVPLLIMMAARFGHGTVVNYVEHHLHFQEPIFVVVIMALASTRPILDLAERLLRLIASLGRGSAVAWWFAILIVGPLLGSFITEPGAMTISALLLARQFYRLQPPKRLAYATLGLLFVNVSVGGTLTHFAAPPVLMVAGKWNWDLVFMATHFGWQAALGITVSTVLTYLALRRDFVGLADPTESAMLEREAEDARQHPVPAWITGVHLLIMAWTVLNSHHSVLVIGGFLLFLAFHAATEDYQAKLELRGPILVGFFLAGLVIHGGLQQWWIAPTLGGLSEWPLFSMATVLTAFNDNAAITYLASLVPGFTDSMKHAVVAGAVTGGGLTVIANAPNPAGQSILSKYFPGGVSPLGLALGALGPTLIVGAAMMLLAR
ncbi:MAG: putative Na+/H+ antiporter [Verrucomicrobiales bacterium]|nr:putative Na+/H+ antiporter [Verrucomicrobiales bacterium]